MGQDWKRNSQLTVETEYKLDYKYGGANMARKSDVTSNLESLL
jgi:hypothetical protein